jgi:hypothetical protein
MEVPRTSLPTRVNTFQIAHAPGSTQNHEIRDAIPGEEETISLCHPEDDNPE